MVDKSAPEPAGAERFRAVSAVNETATVSKKFLEELVGRVHELETVVHTLAPFNQNAAHPWVKEWLAKVGQRLLAIPLRKV